MKAVDFVSRHFKSGGTGFANFSAKQFDIYAETIRRLGNPRYIISMHPMKGTERMAVPGSLSVHYMGDIEQKLGGTGDFWSLHATVQGEHAQREAARKEKEERNKPKTVQVGDYKITVSLDAAGGLVVLYSGGPAAQQRDIPWPSMMKPFSADDLLLHSFFRKPSF